MSYGRGKRSYVSVVREHYLREDIPCGSELCVLCRDISSHNNKKKGVTWPVSYFCVYIECMRIMFLFC